MGPALTKRIKPTFEYDVKQEIQMRVTTTNDGKTRTYFKKFEVASRRVSLGAKEYRLTDPITYSWWASGDWFGEGSLRPSN
jgi:hypothetical protein